MKNIFLNASKNRNGTTAKWADKIFDDIDYQTIHLVEHRIDQIGQQSDLDEYAEVVEKLSHADVIVIGTPVYWSSMTGFLKTFIDRLSDTMTMPLDSKEAPLNGARVFLIIQGTAPEDAIPGIKTVVEHICSRFFMDYSGDVFSLSDAYEVNGKLKSFSKIEQFKKQS